MIKSIKFGFLISLFTFLLGWTCVRALDFFGTKRSVSPIQPVAISIDAASVSLIPAHEQEVLDTVFRYQMKQCFAGEPPAAFFLSFKRRDIPDEFLASFGSESIPVYNRSARRQFIVKTNQLGIAINVSEIDFVNSSIVQVSSTCSRGGLEGSSYLLQLRRTDNVWEIVASKRTGIA